MGSIFDLLHSQKKPVQKHSIQHRSELEENTEKEIFFISEANHTNHLNSSHKYTEYTAEVFKCSQARSQSLLPKNKHSLLIPSNIILILTCSTPIFFSIYLQPTPVLYSTKCLSTPLKHLQCGVFRCNARL